MKYGMIVAIAAVLLAGCDQWGATRSDDITAYREGCIEARCVATYHHENSPYWTDQRHRFCPSAVVFEAWGTEPEGAWQCSFSRGQFSKNGLDGAFMKSLPGGLMDAALAKLVYYSFTAGAGFEPSGLTPGESVSIEGRRHESLHVHNTGRAVTLYRNVVTGRMEMVRITDAKGLNWLAHSYNLRYNARLERMVPRKLDIFDVSRGIPAKRLLVEFDYIDVQ